MKLLTFTAIALLASATARADVRVSIQNGLVTVVATDATVGQIIEEWARVGQAKVINGDRIPGGPMTLELTDVPEAQLLDTLLRSAAGYLAAPRAEANANLSTFDRIVIMPTSSAPRTGVLAGAPPAFQQPQFTQPQFTAPAATLEDDPDDERPANAPAAAPGAPRAPVFNAFQPPQVVNPPSGAPASFTPQPAQAPGQQPAPSPAPQPVAPQPAAYPTNPYGGVAVPGMIVPAPPQTAQPGQIGAPAQTGQPRRPGGGDR